MNIKKKRYGFLFFVPFVIIILSAFIAVVIGLNCHKRQQDLDGQVYQSFVLKHDNLKGHVEGYFNIIGSFPVFVSLHEGIVAMNSTAKTFVSSIFEERYQQHKLSGIYIIERDFDGKRPPFMTYEHRENEISVEKMHDLESKEEEYSTQIEQVRKFTEDPTLKVQISSPVQLCLNEQEIIYSVPIRNDKELVGIVSGMVPLVNISSALEIGDYGATSMLINDRGDMIFCTKPDEGVKLRLEKQFKNQSIKRFVGSNKKPLELDGYVCLITELDFLDTDRWYLVTVQPAMGQLASHTNNISFMGYIIAVLTLITGIILAFLCRLLQKKILAEQRERFANEAKGQFLANMSHEIRTPMTAIIGFTNILTEEDLTEQQCNYVKMISDADKYLLLLINDILDFSKIEAGKLEVEFIEFSLYEKLNEIQTMLFLKAEEKGIEFRVNISTEVPSVIYSDPLRLHQCLINLANNAIEFTKKGHVYINVSLERNDFLSFIRFDIEDTGAGIPKDLVDAIFESYTQSDQSTSHKFSGTGLGLAITKRLANLIGGELSLSTHEGKGSTFSLVIPVNVDVTSSEMMKGEEWKGVKEEIEFMSSARFTGQIVQNEKLASIGQLAAEVAHEINNPMGFVYSNFETLQDYIKKYQGLFEVYDKLTAAVKCQDNKELLKAVESIGEFREDQHMDFIFEDIQCLFSDMQEGLTRITNIVQSLRNFSRIDQAEDFADFNLNNAIESTLVIANNEIKYDADVITDFGELPMILCNPGQLNQVFLNIFINAAQAIKSQETNKKGLIKVKTFVERDYVVCEIADDGPGIAPNKMSKIFDPFFTTKAPGKGTGLGLSVSHDIIVNKHKGTLLVDSTIGEGTKFTIKLPILRDFTENEKEENSMIASEVNC